MSYSSKVIEVIDHDGFREVKLNRPEKKNALNASMIHDLTRIFKESSESKDPGLILLSGKEGFFSSGADLEWMKGSVDQHYEEYLQESRKLAVLFDAVYNCSKIVISKVQKGCFGGANGLVAASDLAVATDDTRFAFSEVKLGLVPATIAPYVMLKIGPAYSRQFMYTARVFNAIEAREAGLIHHTGNEESVDRHIDALVSDMLGNGPDALIKTKALIRKIESSHMNEDLLEHCARIIAEARSGKEGKEGIRAFFEKRKPNWYR